MKKPCALVGQERLFLAVHVLCCIFIGFSYSSDLNSLRFSSQKSTASVQNPRIHQIRIAQANTGGGQSSPSFLPRSHNRWSGLGSKFTPGEPAPAFKLPTLAGDLVYPGPVINRTTPVVFHSYNPDSAFLRCLWNCSGSVEDFVAASPRNVHYVFLSSGKDALSDVLWMMERLRAAALLNYEAQEEGLVKWEQLVGRLHFVKVSTWALKDLGVWIPDLLRDWACQDHNCGLDQVLIKSADMKGQPLVLPRLDARYDWLPSPALTFGNKTLPGKVIGNGCVKDKRAKGVVAIVSEKDCDYFQKIQAMSASGALGVLVVQDLSLQPPDMNCKGIECDAPLNIPGSTIPNHLLLRRDVNFTIQYRNLASENFFSAIDQNGRLAEVGWLLHPSLVYLPWQAQWFIYRRNLDQNLSEEAFHVNIFNNSVMRGDKGVSANVTLPPLEKLAKYDRLSLDFSLSCQGKRDEDCPHWDRTIQLFVCCSNSSSLCGAELGRWISPFRRRIGRWLTAVDSLIPLLDSQQCTFTVTGALWDELWMPTANLRFSRTPAEGRDFIRPTTAKRWINGTFTFDKNYNKRFRDLIIKPSPLQWKQVKIFSVITGHGSDENGCGEFCVTSHHFVINKRLYNMTFSNAGTPLGCADRVLLGVEPNEHGTWLYGRNGWCDGQQVDPWVIDITGDLDPSMDNVISYFGWFRGGDPDPRQSPGVITIHAYVVFFS